MYTLLKQPRTKAEWAIETSTFIAALVLAEVVYKFHSFSLECLAFLATWTVASRLVTVIYHQPRSS